MNKIVKSLFLFCVFVTTTNPSFSEEDVKQSEASNYDHLDTSAAHELLKESSDQTEGQHVADNVGKSDYLEQHSKPLRSIFLGIYKNYKSTYLGNKTLTEYKQLLRDQIQNKQHPAHDNLPHSAEHSETDGVVTEYPDSDNEDSNMEATTTVPQPQSKQETKNKLSPDRKRNPNVSQAKVNQQNYNVGPALNLSLDIDNSIVKVNLDGESLKELVTGRWLSDNSEEGKLDNII